MRSRALQWGVQRTSGARVRWARLLRGTPWLGRTHYRSVTKCLLLIAALGIAASDVLAQGGESVDKGKESTVTPPLVPPEASFVETPGHKISFNPDGTVASSTNEKDGVTVDADGSVYADSGSQCIKGEISRVRECRRNGPGVYLFVDVEYQVYTCGGKKGHGIKSFKIVKDLEGNPANCFGYEYNQQAKKAAEWGESWDPGECEGQDTVKVMTGLVKAVFIDKADGGSVWRDQAGNEFTGWYDPNTGEGFWDGPGKPPTKPKPEDLSKWQLPGGAEKSDTAADGTQHRHYPNGTDIYLKPDGTTQIVNPDGSQTVFEKSDPHVDRYDKVTKYPPGSGPPSSLPSPADVQKILDKDPTAADSLLGGPPKSSTPEKKPAPPGSKSAPKSASKAGQKGTAKVVRYVSKSDVETALNVTGMTERTYCPPPTEEFKPDKPVTEKIVYRSFSVSTDSTKYCTFGEAVPTERILERVSQDIAAAGTPAAYVTDSVPSRDQEKQSTNKGGDPKGPPTPAVNPTPTAPKTAETPTPAPTPTETPKKPDQPLPTTTTDKPPDIPTTPDEPSVTIFIKASESVLDGSQTGEPIQGQLIKLVLKEKPALPTTTENRTATDKGFDKPAPQCTTGSDGQCKVDVPAEDRALYALKETPRTGAKPTNNYRLSVNVMNHAGGVAETTGKATPVINDSGVTAELFKVGNRTFVRLGMNTPSGVINNLIERYSGLFGVPIEIDICLIKEPGPPLGSEPASYSAINQELPHAAVRLPVTRRARR
jgi:hypothetical protein